MMTKWEHRELLKEQRLREKKIKEELLELKEPSKYSNVGASKYEMGSSRARALETMLSDTNISMLERTSDLSRFEELRKRIHRLGNEAYYRKKAETFKENYMNLLSRYSHYENYQKVVDLLSSYKDPETFFRMVNKTELGIDFIYQSDEYYTEQEFNKVAYDLGVEDVVDSVS